MRSTQRPDCPPKSGGCARKEQSASGRRYGRPAHTGLSGQTFSDVLRPRLSVGCPPSTPLPLPPCAGATPLTADPSNPPGATSSRRPHDGSGAAGSRPAGPRPMEWSGTRVTGRLSVERRQVDAVVTCRRVQRHAGAVDHEQRMFFRRITEVHRQVARAEAEGNVRQGLRPRSWDDTRRAPGRQQYRANVDGEAAIRAAVRRAEKVGPGAVGTLRNAHTSMTPAVVVVPTMIWPAAAMISSLLVVRLWTCCSGRLPALTTRPAMPA